MRAVDLGEYAFAYDFFDDEGNGDDEMGTNAGECFRDDAWGRCFVEKIDL